MSVTKTLRTVVLTVSNINFALISLSVANKVALLIGNKDYQHSQQLGKLFHPINDVCDLTGRLLNMNGFKVS